MLLDNALQHFRACRVVPDAVGIDDSDGPGGTNLQAISLGALNPTARVDTQALIAPFNEFFINCKGA